MLLLVTRKLAKEVEKSSKLGLVSGLSGEEAEEGSSSTWHELVHAQNETSFCDVVSSALSRPDRRGINQII